MRVSKQPKASIFQYKGDLDKLPTYKLMERLGFFSFPHSGIAEYSTAGQIIMDNIESIVRRRSRQVGFDEVYFPTIQDRRIYSRTGRDKVFEKEFLKANEKMIMAPTQEEYILSQLEKQLQSHKQLPVKIFQITHKYRNCVPNKGIMRNREFLMLDAFSAHANRQSLDATVDDYSEMVNQIALDLGIKYYKVQNGDATYVDYVVLTDDGYIYLTDNNEYSNKKTSNLGSSLGMYYVLDDEMINDFKFKVPDLSFISYGIGISRLFHAVVDQHRNHEGIDFPEKLRPFKFGLIPIFTDEEEVMRYCDDIYQYLLSNDVQVLYDDRKGGIRKKAKEHKQFGISDIILIGKDELRDNNITLDEGKNTKKVKREDLL